MDSSKVNQMATGAVLACVVGADVAEVTLSDGGRVRMGNGMELFPAPPHLDPAGATEIPAVDGARLGLLVLAVSVAPTLEQLGGGDPTRRAVALASTKLNPRQWAAARLALACERSIRVVARELDAMGSIPAHRLAGLLAGAKDVEDASAEWAAGLPALTKELGKLAGEGVP